MTNNLVQPLAQSKMHVDRKCLRNEESQLLGSPSILHQPIHIIIQLRYSSDLSLKALDCRSDLVDSLFIFGALCFHLLLYLLMLPLHEPLESSHFRHGFAMLATLFQYRLLKSPVLAF